MKLDSSIAAVVTGGASGLGEATARALAAHGVKVAIFDLSASAKGEALRQGDRRRRLLPVQRHLRGRGRRRLRQGPRGQRPGAHPGQLRRHRQRRQDRQPRPQDRRDQAASRLDAFNLIIQINLVGTFRCIAKSAAGMLTLDPLADGERGAIVNTASVAAEDGQIGQAAYTASKGGVVGMTLPIARDLASEGIRCNTILPGIFDTPLMAGAPQQVKAALARLGALPEAPRQARGVRLAGAGDDPQRLLQRRGRAPRRRDPHGAALAAPTASGRAERSSGRGSRPPGGRRRRAGRRRASPHGSRRSRRSRRTAARCRRRRRCPRTLPHGPQRRHPQPQPGP